MLEQQIEVRLGRYGIQRHVDAVQWDGGRTLTCVMHEAVENAASARFFATKPSGLVIYNDAAYDKGAGTVKVALTNQALAEAGALRCQVELLDAEDVRVTSFEFEVTVHETLITDEAIESLPETDVLKRYVEAAKQSAEESAESAEQSKEAAGQSAESARQSAESAEKAVESQKAAEAAKDAAETARDEAKDAESSAQGSADAARESAELAGQKAGEAGESAKNAAESAQSASDARDAAESAQEAAERAKGEAVESASKAAESEAAAQSAKEAAETARDAAETAQGDAAESASKAAQSAESAEQSKEAAGQSEQAAKESETQSEHWAKLSESYAHGQTEEREGEETDNAKYYFEHCKSLANASGNVLIPMGDAMFQDLSDTEKRQGGYLYNVTEDFETDESFLEGAGHKYYSGTNVYWYAGLDGDGHWDVLQGANDAYEERIAGIEEDVANLGKMLLERHAFFGIETSDGSIITTSEGSVICADFQF